jgi:hypothetical protein
MTQTDAGIRQLLLPRIHDDTLVNDGHFAN